MDDGCDAYCGGDGAVLDKCYSGECSHRQWDGVWRLHPFKPYMLLIADWDDGGGAGPLSDDEKDYMPLPDAAEPGLHHAIQLRVALGGNASPEKA